MRLITGQEVNHEHIQSYVQRGINYQEEEEENDEEIVTPIIDSAYVILPFHSNNNTATVSSTNNKEEEKDIKYHRTNHYKKTTTMGCLELCMFAEGSRHQEEIIVTGTRGRLEAYLPENKVYSYIRPSTKVWSNRTIPPSPEHIQSSIYDCSNVKQIHGIHDDNIDSNRNIIIHGNDTPASLLIRSEEDDNRSSTTIIPTHSGYHYSSTGIEWYRLLDAMEYYQQTNHWKPLVSLEDGLKAVEIGLHATRNAAGRKV
jgi:hypothetical protein